MFGNRGTRLFATWFDYWRLDVGESIGIVKITAQPALLWSTAGAPVSELYIAFTMEMN